MLQSEATRNKNRPRQHVKIAVLLFGMFLLTSCTGQGEENNIVFVAGRGIRPTAQSIAWSPTNENEVLINAYETPEQPAEIFILNLQTGEKEYIVEPLQNAQFLETKWMPSGGSVLVLAVDTKGFEPSGWWTIDIGSKASERLFGPMETTAWSPDGKHIAVVQRKPKSEGSMIELKLVDTASETEQTLVSYTDVDYTGGISWSPDGKSLVLSLGKYQSSSNLLVVNIENGQVLDISANKKSEQPSWSPKGNIIAFESNGQLHLATSDGKCDVEVPNVDDAWSPTWSPDGKRLGFIAKNGIFYLEIEKVFGRDIYTNLCG